MLEWMLANWKTALDAAAYIVLGASMLVHLIAPLTDSTGDDKAASWLSKAYTWLKRIALNK
jgi:hypothetical protein